MSVLGPASCWAHCRLAMYIVHLIDGDMAGDKNKPESRQSVPRPKGIYMGQAGKASAMRSHMNRNTKRNGVGHLGTDSQATAYMAGAAYSLSQEQP